jgi:O-methyltransferase
MDAAGLYIDLLKRMLTRLGFDDPAPLRAQNWKRHFLDPAQHQLSKRGYALMTTRARSDEQRVEGRDWPAAAETMIGLKRLDNLQFCIETALADVGNGS